MAQLLDKYGRVARDLRVSLTDRCNLRCTYCMPAEGLEWLPTQDTLTTSEVVRLLRIAVDDLGIQLRIEHPSKIKGRAPKLDEEATAFPFAEIKSTQATIKFN